MINEILLAILIFLSLVLMAMCWALIRLVQPARKRKVREVPRKRIPADWDRITKETTLKK